MSRYSPLLLLPPINSFVGHWFFVSLFLVEIVASFIFTLLSHRHIAYPSVPMCATDRYYYLLVPRHTWCSMWPLLSCWLDPSFLYPHFVFFFIHGFWVLKYQLESNLIWVLIRYWQKHKLRTCCDSTAREGRTPFPTRRQMLSPNFFNHVYIQFD